jgi:amino acid adenylation domain-containing protein
MNQLQRNLRGDETLIEGGNPTLDSALESVVEQVLWQATHRPDACAIRSSRGVLSYGELDKSSDKLTKRLKELGVGPDVLVGLCVGRSRAMIVGAIGILRAGGAYLPLDPSDPEKRLTALLKDAQVQVVLIGSVTKLSPPDFCRTLILEDSGDILEPSARPGEESAAAWAGVRKDRGSNFGSPSSSLAYVIYTSGSTGAPKGVEITHASLSNLVRWHLSAFNVTSEDRATQLARVGFDAAVWEIWPYLATGASVHLPPEEMLDDPSCLRDWLVAERITIGFIPTPLAERLLSLEWPENSALRTMLTGGDALHRYAPPGLPFVLVNNYGPTECTVVTTSGIVPSEKPREGLPPIGLPITNARLYVLDELNRPVPPGTVGELYIGGAGVARGYRNNAELTAEKFIPNPFSVNKGERLFRTGDRVQVLADGQLAFLGRVDEQVKVRGFRIEPHEIVAALDSHQEISQSAVVAQEISPGERRLIAYLVPRNGSLPPLGELRDFLKERVPEYMIPALFIKLSALPLTSNGKVDRAALPAPERGEILGEETFTAPVTETERAVGAMLGPLLGLQNVSVSANFFSLGGHSLLGSQLIARLRDAFGVELPLRAIFEAPTVRELSEEVERHLMARLESLSEEEAKRLLDIASRSCAV